MIHVFCTKSPVTTLGHQPASPFLSLLQHDRLRPSTSTPLTFIRAHFKPFSSSLSVACFPTAIRPRHCPARPPALVLLEVCVLPRSLLGAKGDSARSEVDVLDVLNSAAMPRLFSEPYQLVFVPARATGTLQLLSSMLHRLSVYMCVAWFCRLKVMRIRERAWRCWLVRPHDYNVFTGPFVMSSTSFEA